MILRSLIDLFRIRSQDKVRPYLWPDDELAPWFSEAEKEAAIRSRLIHDSEEFTVKTGETTVDLPGSLFDIQYAELRYGDGTAREITGTDRQTLNSSRPGWRTKVEPPVDYIHDDKALVFGAVADADCTLYLEFYRIPREALEGDDDAPEISENHHMNLVDWVLFRAYSKPDPDTQNPGKAEDAEGRFIAYFGARPDADLRRRQNANRPHRNRIHL